MLLIRDVSILIDRRHFAAMVDNLDREVSTISFSLVPIAILMAGIAMTLSLSDTSSPASILLWIIAWGAIVKASLLMLFPRLMAAKAKALTQRGFLEAVWIACLAVGGYLTWVGYS